MNAIVGFSNLMNTDIELSKEERENFTELINTNSDLLLNLINDILDLSRIESGRMSFSFQQYSLNELISTIYQTFQVLMPENVELRMQIPEKSISIPTDKFRLTQGEFYQFNLSSCIRQQNSLTAQFVSFSLSNLANIFYPPQFLQ